MKILFAIILCSVMVAVISPVCIAYDGNIDKYNEEFDYDLFLSRLDGDTVRILEEIGIDELSYDDVFSVSPVKIFEALFSIIGDSVKEPLGFLTIVTGVAIIMGVMNSSVKESTAITVAGGGALALSMAVPVAQTVYLSFSVLESLSVFTTAFSGVFCGVVSAAGSVATGVSYGALTVFFDGFFSGVLSGVSKPTVNAVCAMGFLSCFDVQGLTRHVSQIVKKLYVFLLSFIGTIFSGIVTLKGVLSDGVDNLASRSVRFVVGRSLPVVGGAVSETYSTLVSSLGLIKSTVGAFGIITVIVMVMPAVIRLLVWIACLEFGKTLFEAMGTCDHSVMFSTIKDAFVLLIATITIVTTIFIVSVGVVISVGGAVS